MDGSIALWLTQDGLINGAIYALLGSALLLVFSVTRIIFVPQGDLISYAGMSLAVLQAGQTPGVAWILVGGGLIAACMDAVVAWRTRDWRALPRSLAGYVLLPVALGLITWWASARSLGGAWHWLLVIALMLPLGPIIYRIAFKPVAHASVPVLFMVSIAVHFILQGLALIAFGGEGLRARPIADVSFAMGDLKLSAQGLIVLLATVIVMVGLWGFMGGTVYGQSMRATAVNRIGSRLVGIRPEFAGGLAFVVATTIGAVSGLAMAPITTLYFDTGFVIGLKGFVGAILGGMASFPLVVLGSVSLGLLESFAAFFWSAFKETIVFSLVIPPLIWLSLRSKHVERDDEE